MDSIQFSPVLAAKTDESVGLFFDGDSDSVYQSPLQLRFLNPSSYDIPDDRDDDDDIAQISLESYVAADIARLLQVGSIRTAEGSRSVKPSDIAILVRFNKEIEPLCEALNDLGIPTSMTGEVSVWSRPVTEHIIRWLEALNEPTSASAACAAAATPLFGWTVYQLLSLQEPAGPHEAWDEWCGYIKTWRHQFDRNGFYRVIQKALAQFDVLENLLAGLDGERQVTDLLHCIDLIHETQTKHRFPLAGLLRWLRDPARQDGSSDDELIRLERDDESVRIMTMHKSKGLEFPIVYLPNVASVSGLKKLKVDWTAPSFSDPLGRVLDLRTDNDDDVTHGGASRADFYKAAQRSNQEEDLRLLYVAMTRAKHRCVVYMQQTDELPTAAVGLLFHPPQPPEDEMLKGHHRLDFIRTELSKKAQKIEPEVLEAELKAWNAVIGPYGERSVIGVRTCTYGDLARAPQYARLDNPHPLKTRIFSRNGLEHYWQRSSYSALTRSAHGAVDGLYDNSSSDSHPAGYRSWCG